jgi:hypothetical protein
MPMLHVWLCSYRLLTRSRNVYSAAAEINLQYKPSILFPYYIDMAILRME